MTFRSYNVPATKPTSATLTRYEWPVRDIAVTFMGIALASLYLRYEPQIKAEFAHAKSALETMVATTPTKTDSARVYLQR